MTAELDANLRLRLLDEVSAPARAIEQRFAEIGAAASGSGQRASAAGSRTSSSMAGLARATAMARQSTAALASEARELAVAETRVAASAAQASAAVSRGGAAVATGGRAASRAMAENINLVSELTLGLGALDPRLRSITNSFAMAGNNAFQLASMGLQPIPLAVVSIATTLPSLIAAFNETSEASDSLAESGERVNRSFLERIDAIRQLNEEQARLKRLERGTAERAEQEAALADADRELRDRQAALASARARPTGGRLSDADREVLEQLRAGGGPVNEDTLLDAFVERRRARAGGGAFNEELVRSQEAARAGAIARDEQRIREAEEAVSRAEELRAQRLAGAQAARAREEEEQAFDRSQQAPQEARARVADQLTVAGLDARQRSSIERGLARGELSDAQRRLLGEERAASLLAAQRQILVAEQQAAAARLGRPGAADELEGDPIPPPVAERARRAVARRVEPVQPAREDTSALARFADDLDRARIRLTIEDNRVRVETSGALQVDGSASTLGAP